MKSNTIVTYDTSYTYDNYNIKYNVDFFLQ